MNWFRLLLSIGCTFLTCTAFSQLKFSLQPMPAAGTYGVYVKPCGDIAPSAGTITGSGQVTVVLPLGNDITNLSMHAGVWQQNATVSGPEESPHKNYISFGFLTDSPQILLEAGAETLLFTFEINGTATSPALMENDLDPFAAFPNSLNSNPGNEMSILDVGTSPVGYYYYEGNYSEDDPSSCVTSDTTQTEPVDSTNTNGENPTAVNDLTRPDNYFTLSPNPATQWIKIDFNDQKLIEGTIRLYTANGVAFGQMRHHNQRKMKWNISELPSGLYFLAYEAEGRVLQRDRFLKH